MRTRNISKKAGGFSLIELMVVVGIIGILIAIAIPQYKSYVLRSKLLDLSTAIRPYQVALSEVGAFQAQIPDAAGGVSAEARLFGGVIPAGVGGCARNVASITYGRTSAQVATLQVNFPANATATCNGITIDVPSQLQGKAPIVTATMDATTGKVTYTYTTLDGLQEYLPALTSK